MVFEPYVGSRNLQRSADSRRLSPPNLPISRSPCKKISLVRLRQELFVLAGLHGLGGPVGCAEAVERDAHGVGQRGQELVVRSGVVVAGRGEL